MHDFKEKPSQLLLLPFPLGTLLPTNNNNVVCHEWWDCRFYFDKWDRHFISSSSLMVYIDAYFLPNLFMSLWCTRIIWTIYLGLTGGYKMEMMLRYYKSTIAFGRASYSQSFLSWMTRRARFSSQEINANDEYILDQPNHSCCDRPHLYLLSIYFISIVGHFT